MTLTRLTEKNVDRRKDKELRLVVVIPAWKRHALTRLVLDYWLALRVEGIIIDVLLVYSPEDAAWRDCLPEGYHPALYTMPYKNQPLGEKFNAGIEAVWKGGRGPDAVMICGSDNVASPEYVRQVGGALRRGAKYVRCGELYVYDMRTQSMTHIEVPNVGACVVFSSDGLSLVGGRPYSDFLDQGVDAGIKAKMTSAGLVPQEAFSGLYGGSQRAAVLDVKSYVQTGEGALMPTNIHSYGRISHSFRKLAKNVSPVFATISAHFGEEFADKLASLGRYLSA